MRPTGPRWAIAKRYGYPYLGGTVCPLYFWAKMTYSKLMKNLIALAIVALTLPLWGGALAALIGGGFYLLVQQPILFVVLVGGLFLLGCAA